MSRSIKLTKIRKIADYSVLVNVKWRETEKAKVRKNEKKMRRKSDTQKKWGRSFKEFLKFQETRREKKTVEKYEEKDEEAKFCMTRARKQKQKAVLRKTQTAEWEWT